MAPVILLHAAASALYAALAIYFWQTRWRGTPRDADARQLGLKSWERALLLLPLGVQAWLLHADILAPAVPRFGFAHALAAMIWLAILIYWVESLFYELEGMLPPALLAAAVVTPLPALFPGLASGNAASFEFKLHLVLAMLAYSFFTLAMLHAILMALVERKLHDTRRLAAQADRAAPFSGALGGLPPLLTLERLLFRLIAAAFVLLTATLATGFVFSEQLFGRALSFDHKTLFALLSWATFAVLLAGRYVQGWRGRTALRWTLGGFLLLLLAYVGSRFVLEVVLQRVAPPL